MTFEEQQSLNVTLAHVFDAWVVSLHFFLSLSSCNLRGAQYYSLNMEAVFIGINQGNRSKRQDKSFSA